MSLRDPDVRYERPEQAVPFMIEAWVRQHLHTGIFGIVRAYDAGTKRADVQPVVRRILAPTPDDPTTRMDRPPILNVPVRQTATGGHLVHHEVVVGDVVWLDFSERGLDNFKARWGEIVDPTVDALFSDRDAVAIPWGTEDIAPVRSTGWIAQNRAGTAYVSVDGDTIRLVTGSSSIVMTPDEILIDSPHVGIND